MIFLMTTEPVLRIKWTYTTVPLNKLCIKLFLNKMAIITLLNF